MNLILEKDIKAKARVRFSEETFPILVSTDAVQLEISEGKKMTRDGRTKRARQEESWGNGR